MGELQRWRENRAGELRPALSDISSFTIDEIDRGHRRRLDSLARQIEGLNPDLVFLQEVGAGNPLGPKNCEEFYKQWPGDDFGLNAATRLGRRLGQKRYDTQLACRGNTGWYTFSETNRESRIVRLNGGRREVVFDFDSNPYPEGMIVEGLAVLVRADWRVLDNQVWALPLGGGAGDLYYVQVLALQPPLENGWILAANIHGSHKLRHFEAAVALRRALLRYVAQATPSFGLYRGQIVAGDFNAILYRPASQEPGEIAMVPWEVRVPGAFDFGAAALAGRGGRDLSQGLWQLNFDPAYKTWATINDPHEARRRIDNAVSDYERFLDEARQAGWKSPSLVEGLSAARAAGHCHPIAALHGSCKVHERIDYLFTDSRLVTEEASLLYADDSDVSLDGPSDHPGLLMRLDMAR